jgi:lysophospholipase L1-like esterase
VPTPNKAGGPGPRIARYCSALFWIRTGSRGVPVLPWIAVRYFVVFFACVGALVAIVEFQLRIFATEGQVSSQEWRMEDESISRMNSAKIMSDTSDPVWRSVGIPAPGEKGRKKRILVIGDSFVWGAGHTNANEIWWRQLERELRHRGYFDVEVVAAGLSGASTQHQLGWLRDLGLLDKLRPDLVVMGYVTNDPDTVRGDGKTLSRVMQFGVDVPLPTWPRLDDTLGLVAPHLTNQIKEALTARWKSRRPDVYSYREWELKLLEPPNIDAYRTVVGELGRLVKTGGTPLFVVTLPNFPSTDYFEPRYRPVAPIFTAAGLPFYDLLGDFVREYSEIGDLLRWGVNPANGHPGPVGTRFYARKVTDILERDFPLTLGGRDQVQDPTAPAINDWMPPEAGVRKVGIGEWELDYPEPGKRTPMAPLGKPHVSVAFADPVAIRHISVSGEALVSAQLHLTAIDAATGVEQKRTVDLGGRNGSPAQWALGGAAGAAAVSTLKLVAAFDSAVSERRPRTLRLNIEFADRAARP